MNDEPTWNKKQIEKAMDKCHPRDTGCYARNKELIFAELERPAYVPKVGEVYYWANIDEETYYVYDPDCKQVFRLTDTVRPLTRKECGPVGRALGVAVGALVYALSQMSQTATARPDTKEALAKIKRLEAGE